jgi:hypothetical protein
LRRLHGLEASRRTIFTDVVAVKKQEEETAHEQNYRGD